MAIIGLVGQAAAFGQSVGAVVETLIIIVPAFVFAFLLIASTLLAWRAG